MKTIHEQISCTSQEGSEVIRQLIAISIYITPLKSILYYLTFPRVSQINYILYS